MLEVLGYGLAIYLILGALFYFFQHYFFFRPEILPDHFSYQYPFPFDEISLEMEDGGRVNGLHFKVPNTKGLVLYFKGNSRSVKGWGKFARDFIGKGYDFFVFDYRGFGKSRGKRTENILYNDAQHIYKWLLDQYAEEEIIIYGRSLGSGIATRIASWNRPQALVLDSPYYSFLAQVQRYGWFLPIKWLLRYQIRTDQYIKKVACPIYILHGKRDRLIPYQHSLKLKEIAPDQVLLFPIEEGGHNNLPDFPEYHDLLYEILHGRMRISRPMNTST